MNMRRNNADNGYGNNYNDRKRPKLRPGTREYIIIALIAVLLVVVSIFGYLAYKTSHSYTSYSYGGGGGGGGGLSLGSASIPTVDNGVESGDVLARIAGMNNGVLPEISIGADGVPVFIDGKFSEVKVRDFSTAMLAINEIKGLLFLSNPAAEFTGEEIYELGDRKIYILQQIVSGIPVYGKKMRIETEADGTITALSCDYDPGITVVTTPTVNSPTEDNGIVKATGYQRVFSSKLCIYNYSGQPKLAWCVDVGTENNEERRLFISASDGALIRGLDLRKYEDAAASDMYGRGRTIGVDRGGSGYILYDPARRIRVFDCGGMSVGNVVTSPDNSWGPDYVSAAANVRDIYDYYKNTLGSPAFRRGKLSGIDVNVRFRRDPGSEYSYSECMTDSEVQKAVISIGDGSNQIKGMDIAAHEFTHAIMDSIGELDTMNETGAISEAYCDIMSVLIRDISDGTTNWKFGTERTEGIKRNLENPIKTRQPNKLGGRYFKDYCSEEHDHTTAGCDNGGIHTNCSIVGHAAYLMSEGGNFSSEELARIFALSMNYLVPTSDYGICRAAIIHAARMLGFGEDKRQVISNAFKSVGIEYRGINADISSSAASEQTGAAGTLTGKVASATSKNPLSSAQINSSSIDGKNVSRQTTTNSEGVFTQELSEGMYMVNVSMPGYKTCSINNVQITASNATNLQNTVLLEAIAGDPRAIASGRITNAVSGEGVGGAKIHFMTDWGNTSGSYVKGRNGEILELITDSSGAYYTDDLIYGYYTGEVTIPGYATQYFNIIASNNGNVSSNQNVVMSPEAASDEMRITLQWNELPKDEDAHLKGNKPGDFHVYYDHRAAKFRGETVATLDHDDRDGNGFETITLKMDNSAQYRYYVRNYSQDGELSASNAIVKVYSGNIMLAQYNVPTNQGSGEFWNVFRIENGKVIPVNTITDEEP